MTCLGSNPPFPDLLTHLLVVVLFRCHFGSSQPARLAGLGPSLFTWPLCKGCALGLHRDRGGQGPRFREKYEVRGYRPMTPQQVAGRGQSAKHSYVFAPMRGDRKPFLS